MRIPMRAMLPILVLAAILPLTVGVALAAEGAGHGPTMDWRSVGWKTANFAVLFGALYYLLNQPVRTFLRGRREKIAQELAEARRERDEAETKLKEIEASLAGADNEAAELRRKAEEDAAAEREQILKAAEEEAARIRATAQREIARATEIARRELRAYAAELAAERAAAILKEQIDDEDRRRLLRRYLGRLEGGLPS